ncbi:MAG: hypothetical protein EA376_06710 [Phycisphaeraceae bacterium]|nr:MAG: hypothetical protein EA376_06710 [Phycisphaeraceae bacterium]
MSYLDRDHETSSSGGAGRFRQAFGRIFGDAENPLGWALSIGRVAGIRVRLHLFFLVYVLAMLLTSIGQGHLGVGYMALAMGGLFTVVLLHEFGHCFACRAVEGEASEILMWPLGGLAMCDPPHSWRANFITTAGGPAVNVAILPLTVGGLLLAGRADTILFNPFMPGATVGSLDAWWLVGLWWLHYLNLLILGFNVLIPMFPMDGGRLVQAMLWSRVGYRQATETTVIIGFVGAGVLGVIALVANQVMLLAIAGFGAVMCWRERKLLRMEAELGAGFGPGSLDDEDETVAERERRRYEKERLRDAKEQAELDRILAKIADRGMASLSIAEKRSLKRATQRRQRG